MHKCMDCKREFDELGKYYDDCTPGGASEYGFTNSYSCCPYCESGNYEELKECERCEYHEIEKYGHYTEDGFLCMDCYDKYENEGSDENV